jgi:hypothetical protein
VTNPAPEELVWHVVATGANYKSQGSAIAIRLQDGDDDRDETYLITCNHVVRGEAQLVKKGEEGVKDFGPIPP